MLPRQAISVLEKGAFSTVEASLEESPELKVQLIDGSLSRPFGVVETNFLANGSVEALKFHYATPSGESRERSDLSRRWIHSLFRRMVSCVKPGDIRERITGINCKLIKFSQ